MCVVPECGHVHAMAHMNVEVRDQFLGVSFLLLPWVPGIELRSSGMCNKLLYEPDHLMCPSSNFGGLGQRLLRNTIFYSPYCASLSFLPLSFSNYTFSGILTLSYSLTFSWFYYLSPPAHLPKAVYFIIIGELFFFFFLFG